ncbi:MAG: I78 family peptidase inhibitor [Pedobacter sp.]|nr:I78 family peptidase inhibitor [Pedobacter sp.]
MRSPLPLSSSRQLFIALSLSGSLVACSATAAAPKAATEPPAPEPAQQIAMGCLEANANWTIGKQVDDALIAKAKTDAEAHYVRVLKPGQAVTMEYNGARLNLHANTKGMIERVSCG